MSLLFCVSISLFNEIYALFTSLRCMHCMQRGLTTRKLYVRPSVCQTRDLWQNDRNMCQHSYATRKIIHLSFVSRGMVEILGQTDPIGAKTPIFNRYSLLAP